MARCGKMPFTHWINPFFLLEPYYSVQWYLVFAKVKACDGSLVPVNHYCRRGLGRNVLLYCNEPGEM